MSFILLGILNSQVSATGPSYWIASIGGSGAQESTYAIAVDENSNVYVPINQYEVAQVSPNGDLSWQKSITSIGNSTGLSASNTNGNIQSGTNYGTFSGSPGGWEGSFVKRNSSGVLQWQRYIGTSGNDIMYRNALDTSGNVYVVGNGNGTGATGGGLVKVDSSGALTWARTLLASSGRSITFWDVKVTSAGDIYVCGDNNFSSGSLRGQVAKYNSSGTLQWQRYIDDGNSSGTSFVGLALDSSENVYVVGETYASTFGGPDALIVKYNSSGTYQWQRRIGGSNNDFFRSVSVDSLGNVYAFGESRSINSNAYSMQFFAKYDSSGNLLLQRSLDVGRTQNRPMGVVAADDTIYMTGVIADNVSSTNAYAIKLPIDGSKTGTYSVLGQSVTYAVSSLSTATPTLENGTSSQSEGTTGWSLGVTSGTDGTPTYTLTKTTI